MGLQTSKLKTIPELEPTPDRYTCVPSFRFGNVFSEKHWIKYPEISVHLNGGAAMIGKLEEDGLRHSQFYSTHGELISDLLQFFEHDCTEIGKLSIECLDGVTEFLEIFVNFEKLKINENRLSIRKLDFRGDRFTKKVFELMILVMETTGFLTEMQFNLKTINDFSWLAQRQEWNDINYVWVTVECAYEPNDTLNEQICKAYFNNSDDHEMKNHLKAMITTYTSLEETMPVGAQFEIYTKHDCHLRWPIDQTKVERFQDGAHFFPTQSPLKKLKIKEMTPFKLVGTIVKWDNMNRIEEVFEEESLIQF